MRCAACSASIIPATKFNEFVTRRTKFAVARTFLASRRQDNEGALSRLRTAAHIWRDEIDGSFSERGVSDQGRRPASREADVVRTVAAVRANRGIQPRAREVDFPAELQADYAARGPALPEAGADRIRRDERQRDRRTASAVRRV